MHLEIFNFKQELLRSIMAFLCGRQQVRFVASLSQYYFLRFGIKIMMETGLAQLTGRSVSMCFIFFDFAL